MCGTSVCHLGHRVTPEALGPRGWARIEPRAQFGVGAVRKPLVLMVLAIAIPFLGAGCSAMILASQNSLENPASSTFPLGTSRQEVEMKLGKPAASRPLPDGGRADTYKYIIRKVADLSLTGRSPLPNRIYEFPTWYLLGLSAISLGGTDIVFVPAVMYDISKNRQTATFTYDPSDNLLEHGPPPPYGPPDGAVGSLPLNDIRERCRSDASGAPGDLAAGVTGGWPTAGKALYDECFVRRLAVWGIE